MRVYSEQVFEGLPAFTVLRLRQVADSTYEIHGRWLWKRGRKTLTNGRLYSESGVLATHLQIAAAQGTFHFKHRHWVPGDACYRGDIGLAAADA